MKVRNYYIYNDDVEVLKRLEEDYTFLGRNVRLEAGRLVVFTQAKKRKKIEKSPKRR